MSILGRWSAGASTPDPTTSFASPSGLFGSEDRNDGSAYTFTDSTATLTLPSSALADGYLMVARIHYVDTTNSRSSIAIRIQQTGGTGDFVNGQCGGYQRQTSDDEHFVSCFAFVNNPSASATFQLSWKSMSDVPAGGCAKSVFEVIPFFYSNHGLYTSADLTLMGGTTPNVVPISTTVAESDTNAIERATNVITVKGDNKRYFLIASHYSEGRGEPSTTRTQRIYGFDYDGSQELATQAYSYHRQGTSDGTGSHYHDIIETVTANRTIEMTCYRGDGVANGDGGGDVDSGVPDVAIQALVVLELNDSAECFRTHDATGLQALDSVSPLDLNSVRTTDFIDAASWVKVGTVGMENNDGATFDALTGANVWAAATDVGSNLRSTWQVQITVDGVEDDDLFDGNFVRGNQAGEDTFAFAANPIGFRSLADNADLGVSTVLAGGNRAQDTQAGTVGQWGINLDTMEDAGGAIAATPDLVVSIPTADLAGGGKLDATPDLVVGVPTADLGGKGKLDASPDLVFASASADLTSTSALDATPDLAFASVSADLNATGKLDATASLALAAATALLRGTGLLGATAALAFASASADLRQAPSLISASPALTVSATADLTARGKLDATAALVFNSVSADLTAIGLLTATPDMAFAAAIADLNATGLLGATAALVFSVPTADLEATGLLTATSPLVFAIATADLKELGGGQVSATPDLVFSSATADLLALGKLDATVAMVLSQTASLAGQGKLDATIPLAFSQTASLAGKGQLSVTSALAFSIPSVNLTAVLLGKFGRIILSAKVRTITLTGKAGQFN